MAVPVVVSFGSSSLRFHRFYAPHNFGIPRVPMPNCSKDFRVKCASYMVLKLRKKIQIVQSVATISRSYFNLRSFSPEYSYFRQLKHLKGLRCRAEEDWRRQNGRKRVSHPRQDGPAHTAQHVLPCQDAQTLLDGLGPSQNRVRQRGRRGELARANTRRRTRLSHGLGHLGRGLGCRPRERRLHLVLCRSSARGLDGAQLEDGREERH